MTTSNDRADPVTALVPRAADPARGGAEAATQVISAQAAAGVSLDRMTSHSADTAAWLFSEATTPDGERFAAGYTETADSLLAELRETAHRLPQPGSPHPDPVLAARGWEVSPHGAGVYIRSQAGVQPDRELEAG